MAAPLITMLGSGSITVMLIALFRYEQAHRIRFVRDLRLRLDRTLETFKDGGQKRFRQLTGHTMRQSVHYILHQILTALLRIIHRFEASVRSVARFNKNRARRPKAAAPESHLSAIANHKREVQLSEIEKQERSDAALSGR